MIIDFNACLPLMINLMLESTRTRFILTGSRAFGVTFNSSSNWDFFTYESDAVLEFLSSNGFVKFDPKLYIKNAYEQGLKSLWQWTPPDYFFEDGSEKILTSNDSNYYDLTRVVQVQVMDGFLAFDRKRTIQAAICEAYPNGFKDKEECRRAWKAAYVYHIEWYKGN